MEHWLTLANTRGLGPVLIRRLIEQFGSAEIVCNNRSFRGVGGIGATRADDLAAGIRAGRDVARLALAEAETIGVSVVCPDDETYPLLVRDLPDAPPVLWIWGKLEPRDLNAIAIVGSRQPTSYGQEQSRRFASLLAGAGFTVISGGAYGVDTHAHRGALLATDGRTVAVLGCGVDIAYPPENGQLFDDIAEGRGAIISELPLGTHPRKENFPRRNRIISGMCRGVLVVEAAERSGALITARVAADEHNRPVFAMPGRIDNLMSAGPHGLLRDGAILAATLEDIIDNLGPLPTSVYKSAPPPSLFEESPAEPTPVPAMSDSDRAILHAIDAQPLGVDAICDATALSAQQVQAAMTLLSIKGLVKRVEGNRYGRK